MTNVDDTNANSEHLDEAAFTDIVAGTASKKFVDQAFAHIRNCPRCEMRLLEASGDLETCRAKPAPSGWGMPVRARSKTGLGGLVWPPRRRLDFRLAIPLALAAMLLVMLRIGLPRRHPSETHPYWIPATGELHQLRGAHSWDADSTFWQGLDAYEAHNTGRAAELLQDAKTTGGLEDLRRLYLASSLINAGQGQHALQLFDELKIEDLPAPWRADAYWMKFQVLAGLNRSAEAEKLLDEMVAWPGRVGDLARTARAAEQHH